MFKKILLLLLIITPLLFVFFVGYPILTPKQMQQRSKQNIELQPSRRCYAIYDLNSYIRCLINDPRLNGIKLFKIVYTEISMMYPGLQLLVSVVFLLQIFLIIKILNESI